jgi:DHA2 family methylenomycin A resistance protein-like MFS transporter
VSLFPPERRGSALGIWGASSGIANLLGPFIGGVLTTVIGWRANFWALLLFAAFAAYAVWRLVPADVREDEAPDLRGLRQSTIAAAAVAACVTFMVMIGTFFLAQQYLQEARGYTALEAGTALVLVALIVGAAAPVSGRLADLHGARLPTVAGFCIAAVGLGILGIPGVPLHGAVALLLLIPVGFGLGLLFAPVSRAALNSVPVARHGRVSAALSAARLLGAGVGAALAGLAISGGVTADHVHDALLVAAGLCLVVGVPAALRLDPPRRRSGAVESVSAAR